MKKLTTFILCLTAALGWGLPVQQQLAGLARIRRALSAGTPPEVAGLVMWLKADSFALADGADLSAATWQDSHTSNKDATLTGGTGDVTYQTNEINGHACVRFISVGSGNTALNLVAPYTIFVVEKSAANSDHRTISSLENNRVISNGRDSLQGFVGGIVASGSQNTAWCYSALIVPASGNCSFFQNGVDETTGSITAADWGTVYLGGGLNSELPVSDVAEIICFNVALDATNRGIIETYISSVYGL